MRRCLSAQRVISLRFEFDTARFNVVELVREGSETLGRKGGGGRPEMASRKARPNADARSG
ncbi:hypothetical protein [Bradyrhizobium sp. AZCC 1610]|uniref:hypothetical protein n=1 Tax=Bradyrhizobium sp. AZCC 1610 TaxID=3117020 RepID=UPI002FF22529